MFKNKVGGDRASATAFFLNPEPSPPEQLQNLILFGAK
jgi:hypothetical protein